MLPPFRHSRSNQYFRRLANYKQMDFEYTFWQIFMLCINPSKVYRTTTWHKQTKNQWARDDPAFVVTLTLFTLFCSVAFGIAMHASWYNTVVIVLYNVVGQFLGVGVVMATITWYVGNRYLRMSGGMHTHSLEQSVEWLYAFDVHCNGYVPVLLLLHVVQYLVWPLLLSNRFVAALAANTLYFVAFSYYWHITFLGFNALPFLQSTEYFVMPIGLLIVFYFVALASGTNCAIIAFEIFEML